MPSNQFMVFTLDGLSYALRLESVERVERIVEITPVPQSPEIVLGVVNLRGKIVVVLDVRKRLGLRSFEASDSGQLVVARTATRTILFPVDSVVGLIHRNPADVTTPEAILPGLQYVQGVTRLDDGIVFIHDFDLFLSADEDQQVTNMLENHIGSKN